MGYCIGNVEKKHGRCNDGVERGRGGEVQQAVETGEEEGCDSGVNREVEGFADIGEVFREGESVLLSCYVDLTGIGF